MTKTQRRPVAESAVKIVQSNVADYYNLPPISDVAYLWIYSKIAVESVSIFTIRQRCYAGKRTATNRVVCEKVVELRSWKGVAGKGMLVG